MIAVRPWAGLAMPAAVLALAAGAPVRAEELWRGPAGTGDCRLELVNEVGGIQVTAGGPAASPAIVDGDPALRVEASAPTGGPVLTVAWAGSTADGPSDVTLSVPPRCWVAVRTSHGAVSVEIGRAAFPARVDTVTGDITAWIHPDTDAAVGFATSGRITSDFTIEIEYRYHAEAWKHGRIPPDADSTPQRAPTPVRLNSRGGAVRMLRPPRDHPLPIPETRHDNGEQE